MLVATTPKSRAGRFFATRSAFSWMPRSPLFSAREVLLRLVGECAKGNSGPLSDPDVLRLIGRTVSCTPNLRGLSEPSGSLAVRLALPRQRMIARRARDGPRRDGKGETRWLSSWTNEANPRQQRTARAELRSPRGNPVRPEWAPVSSWCLRAVSSWHCLSGALWNGVSLAASRRNRLLRNSNRALNSVQAPKARKAWHPRTVTPPRNHARAPRAASRPEYQQVTERQAAAIRPSGLTRKYGLHHGLIAARTSGPAQTGDAAMRGPTSARLLN